MSTTPESKEEVRQLFCRNVPEANTGAVEIVCVARDVGRKSYVAVRSHGTVLDPIGACTGVRGARAKAMVGEFKGEHLTIVRWDESPENFIRNAFGGQTPAEVVLDRGAGTAMVTVEQPGASTADIQLISELTRWRISLHIREA
jgi:transcription termination/antitermination protein NusA